MRDSSYPAFANCFLRTEHLLEIGWYFSMVHLLYLHCPAILAMFYTSHSIRFLNIFGLMSTGVITDRNSAWPVLQEKEKGVPL